METKDAVAALTALAQEHRLKIFRLLVRQGPNGLAAGAIAERIDMPASTLSHHLGLLERSGLLRARRADRRIFYAVDIEGTRRLITFLTEDCCRGHPEMCGYGNGGGCGDDYDLSQSEVRNVAQCAGDDPQLRRGAADCPLPGDAAKPR